MRSSRLVARSAVAVLSAAMLCSLSGTAMSQTSTQLPNVTVEAPKQAARPYRPAPRLERPARVANRVISRPTPQAPPAAATNQKPAPAKGSIMAQLAALERTSSNCTDGCQTSFRYGNQPWNGCSSTGFIGDVFSPTCRNVRNFKTYVECSENGLLLGWRSNETRWYCSSLMAGGKLSGEKLPGAPYQVADLKRSGRR